MIFDDGVSELSKGRNVLVICKNENTSMKRTLLQCISLISSWMVKCTYDGVTLILIVMTN